MRVSLFFATLLFTSAGSVYSQHYPTEDILTKKLSNGLEVLVIEDHTVPLVTMEIACRNGSFTETDDYNGLSHLYEHLFFKANKKYPSFKSFNDKSNELDITSNARTREEVVNYYFTLPAKNMKEGLKFMNAAIRFPKFAKAGMEQENEIVNAEFTRHESSPVFELMKANSRHLWGDNYSRKNAIGNHDVILTATPEKMEAIKAKYYWPNNSLLVIAGDLNPEDAFIHAENIFGSWEKSDFDPFQRWPIPEMKPLENKDYYIVESNKTPNPYLLLSWHGPDTRHDVFNTYVADVFSFIINQNGSKMKKALVDSGLAQEADVNYYTQKYTGPISFMVSPNPNQIKACYQEVLKQISLWDEDDYLSDVQIERAKRLLSIEQVKQRETVAEYAHLLSFWWASASIDYYTHYQDNVNKITRKDLIAYVQRYIKDKPYVAGLMLDKPTIEAIKPLEFFK